MRIGVVAENLIERIVLWMNAAPEPLIETQMAFSMAGSVMAGVKLGVFEAGEPGPKTAAEIAETCGTHPHATEKLLNALTGCGYFRYSGGRYALTPKTRKWLLRSSPENLCDKMLFQFYEYDMVARYDEYVREGKPLHLHGAEDDEAFWNIYQRGMRNLSGLAATEVTSRFPVPAGARDMLDIGGSHGFYSVCLCRKHPELTSVILDLPEAVKQSAAILAEENMGDRVVHREGNALTDDLGENAVDIVFMAQLVHHFTDEQNRALMKKIAGAMRPNGVCVVLDSILPETPGDGGQPAALLDLYFAMLSESGTWPIKTMHDWFAGAGLEPQKPVWLRTMPSGALVIGKKVR